MGNRPGQIHRGASGNGGARAGTEKPPEHRRARLKEWKRGSLNFWCPIIGVNGCGKSTRLRYWASYWAKAGARVFIYDPDGQFPDVKEYESPEAWRRAPNRTSVARFGSQEDDEGEETVSALDVLTLGRLTAKASDFKRPSIVILDEGSTFTEAEKRKTLDKAFKRLIFRRRNSMVGVAIAYQQPSMLSYLNITNATDVELFCIEGRYQLDYLRGALPERVKLTNGKVIDLDTLLQRLPYLGVGEFYHIQKGFQVA